MGLLTRSKNEKRTPEPCKATSPDSGHQSLRGEATKTQLLGSVFPHRALSLPHGAVPAAFVLQEQPGGPGQMAQQHRSPADGAPPGISIFSSCE